VRETDVGIVPEGLDPEPTPGVRWPMVNGHRREQRLRERLGRIRQVGDIMVVTRREPAHPPGTAPRLDTRGVPESRAPSALHPDTWPAIR